MRTMNVRCPACQQTHPNTHVKLLDWQTASFVCPILGQTINLMNYILNGNTMILSAGTTEDRTDDANVGFVITDTTVFGEETAPTMLFYQHSVQNYINDKDDYMQIGGGGILSSVIVPAPTGGGVLAQWPLGVATLNAAEVGDFVLSFGFQMTDLAVDVYQASTKSNLPIGFEVKLYLGIDKYIQLLVRASDFIINYYTSSATPGSPVLAEQIIHSNSFSSETYYNGVIDVTGDDITVTILEGEAKQSAITRTVTIPNIPHTLQKVSFSYPASDWGSKQVQNAPYYTTAYPADGYKPYGDVLYYPTLVIKGSPATNVAIPATPI